MALDDVFAVNRVHQQNQTGDTFALITEEFTGMVEGTIERRSVLKPHIRMEAVRGTDTIRADAVGKSTLQTLSNAGATLDGTKNDFSKNVLTVDTVVAARATFPIIDIFQQNYDKRAKVAEEHGKEIAKFWEQAMFIQAIKASLRTESSYWGSTSGKPEGHFGGSTEVLSASGDATDAAKMYAAIARLLTKVEQKDVQPQADGVMLAVSPALFYTLLQAEQLINSQYVTAAGNTVANGMVLKTYGVPVVRSNDYDAIAGATVASHRLSNARNSNAYDSDFTKVVATLFAPKAVMAGETIPLTSKVFFDDVSKLWFVDAWLAFGATTDRAEYSGSILLP
jgi:hypothetical protein